MPPSVYTSVQYPLGYLVESIGLHNLALPDIQRPFVWSTTKVRELFDSMYRGYPVGTFMFWKTGAEVGSRQIGSEDAGKVPDLLIVDGQQRLTSLYAVMTGSEILTEKFEQKLLRIAFSPVAERFEVADAAIERDPEFISNISVLWGQDHHRATNSFLDQLAESREGGLSQDERYELLDRIQRLKDLSNYSFQVIQLSEQANEEEVAEIFVRVNSEGVQLNQADFILTLMSVHWDKGRRQLEAFSRAAKDPAITGPSPKNAFIEPGADQMLRAGVGLAFRRGQLQHVYSILRGKDLETGDVSADRRTEQFETLRKAQDEVLDLTNWHEFLKCLARGGFRNRRMVTSANAIIFSYIIWLIGRRDFGLDHKTLRPLIARWFFMAHTTGRYTSSPESRIESDLNRISALEAGDGEAFCAELDRLISNNFTRDYWEISLPNLIDNSSPRSPGLYAYWAALNLLDAQLLFSDMKVADVLDSSLHSKKSIERHHLFPKAFLAKQGVKASRLVNAIGNMAFLDWPDNIEISADDPRDYWPKMTDRMPADRLARQIEWHALPVGWEQLEYETFLERRRIMIADVVRRGFETLSGDPRILPDGPVSVRDLIALGESQTLELKSTARWNLHTESADKKMEHVIVKTACGFLNAEGGTLLIGVEDDGNILGLGRDMSTLGSKANRDGYELWLRQHLDNNLSISTAGVVRIEFASENDLEVCVVRVAASGSPVFARPFQNGSGPSEFWVRNGNKTEQLHGDDMMTYRENHWG